jgi:hypothetical protein
MPRIVAPKDIRLHGRTVDHRDGSGHLDHAYEKELRARARDNVPPPERAFVHGSSSPDASAEQAGEEFVLGVTTGEAGGAPELDETSPEERGGPFVATTGHAEFAYGPDESNPKDGTREPFPTTSSPRGFADLERLFDSLTVNR